LSIEFLDISDEKRATNTRAESTTKTSPVVNILDLDLVD
jgi:hypothetical protein